MLDSENNKNPSAKEKKLKKNQIICTSGDHPKFSLQIKIISEGTSQEVLF